MKLIRHKGALTTKFIGLLVPLLLMVMMACTLTEDQLIEGILQNVDSVNGEITIVTKDGKTVTLTIATDAPVETEGASSAFETLEPGTTLEIEVDDDGRIAVRIKARQAKLQGRIVEIVGNEVTIESPFGRTITVLVTENTRIELDDDFPGALSDLRVGSEVEIKFDSESLVAFKIDFEEEEAEIEGVILEITGNEVTIETERGRRLTLIVGERTRFEFEDDFPGNLADLQAGETIEVKFDPFTRVAFKIELEEETAEIQGVILEITGNEVTVETERGRRLTLIVGERTRFEFEDDFPGNLADLQVGATIEAKFDPITLNAFEIEIDEDSNEKEIEGVIVSIDGNEITVEIESGGTLTFSVADQTRIELDDDLVGSLSDLRVGLEIEIRVNTETNVALEVEVED